MSLNSFSINFSFSVIDLGLVILILVRCLNCHTKTMNLLVHCKADESYLSLL